jgi:hypothetical protein
MCGWRSLTGDSHPVVGFVFRPMAPTWYRPATVGSHMTNTDPGPFQDLVPAISSRENERGTQIGNGWDPQWHQPTDRYATYTDKDFRLGLNAAQTTLGAIATLTGTTLRK